MSAASPRFADVAVGHELPTLVVPLTTTVIVAGAIASRDYQEVHHDPGIARERGSRDIIMNILTTNGYVGRFVTDWAGPDALIRSANVRLGAPNHPGDTMTMTGEVTGLDPSTRTVTVAVRGANSLGDHVTATVAVVLP
jgi:acyl dehydratase